MAGREGILVVDDDRELVSALTEFLVAAPVLRALEKEPVRVRAFSLAPGWSDPT